MEVATPTPAGDDGPGRRTTILAAVALLAATWTAAVPAQAQTDGGAAGTCEADARLDVSLVLDRSGSMSGDKIDAAKDGASFLVDQLNANDQSGLVSYSSSATLDQPLTGDHAQTQNAISGLSSGGGTATGDAINLSHEDIRNHGRTGVDPIMVVLTDGHTNEGADPIAEAREAKEDGVEVFAVGLGSSHNAPALKEIASEPTQRHYYAPDDSQDLTEVFHAISDTFNSSAAVAESYGLRGQVDIDGDVPTDLTVHRTNQSRYPEGGAAAVGSVDRSVAGLDVDATVLESATEGNHTGPDVASQARSALARLEVRADGDLLLEARGLEAASESTASVDAPAASHGRTSVSHLRIPGVGNLTGPFDPGTRIPLGSAGHVTVNETQRADGPNASSLRVNALHLEITVGNDTAQLVVGSAYSAASCDAEGYRTPSPAADEPVSARSPVLGLVDEDPPMTGFGPLHGNAEELPNDTVTKDVAGVVEVSRHRTEYDGESYDSQLDTVSVRVVPAETTVTFYLWHGEYEDPQYSYQYDYAYATVCRKGQCTGAFVDAWDSDYTFSGCDGGYTFADVFASTGESAYGAYYYEWQEDCGGADDGTSYRCRGAGVFFGAGDAAADRCSIDQRADGDPQRNENTYYATVTTNDPAVEVSLVQENHLVDGSTETTVSVSSFAAEETVSLSAPPSEAPAP